MPLPENSIACGASPPEGHIGVQFFLHSGKVKGNKNLKPVGATTIWLMCPHINRVIGHLERGGGIGFYHEMLLCSMSYPNQTSFQQAYLNSHAAYLESVTQCMTEEEAITWHRTMKGKFGNGGVSHCYAVKCLHTQVAMQLSGLANPVGKLVIRDIRRLWELFCVCPILRSINFEYPKPCEELEASVSLIEGFQDIRVTSAQFAAPRNREKEKLSTKYDVSLYSLDQSKSDFLSKEDLMKGGDNICIMLLRLCAMCGELNHAYTGRQRHTKYRQN